MAKSIETIFKQGGASSRSHDLAGSRSSSDEVAMYHGYKKLCKIEKLANNLGIHEIASEAHHGGVHLGMVLGLDTIERLEAEGEAAAAVARRIISENK